MTSEHGEEQKLAVEEPGQRLHPLSPLFEIARSFLSIVVPGLLVLFLAAGDGYEIWYMAFFVPAMASALFRYLTLRYTLTKDHIVIREGLIFRSTRHIPYARIQNIDTVQNPLHRLISVAEVRLETASGQEPEAVFRVLSLEKLEEIRAGVFSPRVGRPPAPDSDAVTLDSDRAEQAPSAPGFFRMRPTDVTYFGLLSQKGIAILAGLAFLLWEFDLWDRVKEKLELDPEEFSLYPIGTWALFGLGFLAVMQAVTVAWAFITLYDFHIVRHSDDLRTTCGLWTRQTATLPRDRIQFLSLQEGWLQRMFKRVSVRALTAGGDSTGDAQVSRKWLIPLTKRDTLPQILREVQPQVSFEGHEWRPVHPRARRRLFVRWLIVLAIPVALVAKDGDWWAILLSALALLAAAVASGKRAKRLAYALTADAVYMRDGVVTHVRNAVRFSKIQSISLTQSPFDRRHGMATVRVDTAGTGAANLTLSVPYLPVVEAMRLARRLKQEAARTRFTW